MNIKTLYKDSPVTTVLLAIIILIFIVQVITGVSPDNPSSQDLVNWGANFLPYTLQNQPWRLLTSAFLHIGLMHILFNCFALYYFGKVAEAIFGHWQLLVIFLLSAISGNLLNLSVGMWNVYENTRPAISAGASGGVMGVAAALLIAALYKLEVNQLTLNFRSLLFIMVVNLSYGFIAPGIDNAGHIGGAILGALLALVFVYGFKHKAINKLAVYLFTTVCLSIVGMYIIYWWYLHMQFLALIN